MADVARRRYVDPVTGEQVSEFAPGAAMSEWGVRIWVADEAQPVWVPIPAENVDLQRGQGPIINMDHDELREFAKREVEARQHSRELLQPGPTKKQDIPGLTETYRTAGEGASLFLFNNEEVTEAAGRSDPDAMVKDLLDGFMVARGRKRKDGTQPLKKLQDTAVGQRIMRAFSGSTYAGAHAFLTWLFSQNRQKRWKDVDWSAVDTLGEILLEACENEAERTGERLGCQIWTWYPAGAGVLPLIDQLDQMSERAAGAWEAQSYTDKLKEWVYELRESLKRAKGCLPPETVKLLKKRIDYIAKLSREPWRVPQSSLCVPTVESGYRLCDFPAVRAEARRIGQACAAGYDPEWPAGLSVSAEDAQRLGVPVLAAQTTPEERDLDQGESFEGRDEQPAELWELESIPWGSEENPGRKYSILDARAMNRKHPRTFKLPTKKKLDALRVGDFVKAMFQSHGGDKATERMWVRIKSIAGDAIVGKLDNKPAMRGSGLRVGSVVKLRLKNVIDTMRPKDGSKANPPAKTRRETRSNPGRNPWGELLDLRARVIELEVEVADGVQVHTWNRDRPALFWSESRKALVWVHGGRDPSGFEDAGTAGRVASRHRKWHGAEPSEVGQVELPAGELAKLGPALRIVYTAERYADGVPRHHDFGAAVGAYAQKGRGARVFSVRGGRLTLTDRGLVN